PVPEQMPHSPLLRGEQLRLPASPVAHGQGDEFCPVGGLYPHENVVLAMGLRIGQRLTHIRNVPDRRAADIEDDVAGLEALLSSRPVCLDTSDNHTLVARARHIARWGKI